MDFENEKPRALYIDFNHTCFRTLFVARTHILDVVKANERNGTDDDPFTILRHMLLRNIFYLIESFKPHQVVIACDHRKSWRKKFFPPYKAHRKDRRDKDALDFDKFYQFIENFADELRDNFPFVVAKIANLEADDIIAQMIKKYHHELDITFVTSDADYFQLLQYGNTQMYDPIKQKVIKKTRAEALHDLEMKILTGDKSDNIPACRPRLGPKTAEKIILNEQLDELLQNEDFKKRYEENTRLVDLNNCPKKLVDKLFDFLNNYEVSGVEGVLQYFIAHKLKDLLSRSHEIGHMIRPLRQYNEMVMEKLNSKNIFSL